MCPRCGQNAPLVYRGVMAYCTACGAPRPPLAGASVNLAGQPSKIGGVLASVLGWVVLFGGLSIALIVAAIAHALFPAGFVGLALGAPLAIASIVVGVLLLRGGKTLQTTGASEEKATRAQAVFALAANRGGVLTALDVAQALSVPVEQADALLTSLAKEQYERVAMEIDPNGALYYRFAPHGAPFAPPTGARVRVDPEVARSPNRAEWQRLEELERIEQEERERADAEVPRARAGATPPRR